MKTELVFIFGYFLFLYLMAYFANRDCRENSDVLFISKGQWRAIIILWLPSLIILMEGRK